MTSKYSSTPGKIDELSAFFCMSLSGLSKFGNKGHRH